MFIDTLANDEKYRKCGIGKKMVEYLKKQAKQINCDKIELQVNAKNKKAIGFYEHLGMKEKIKTMELDL